MLERVKALHIGVHDLATEVAHAIVRKSSAIAT